MKNKSILKIIIDIFMFFILVLLFNKNIISFNYHKNSGIFIGFLFLLHIAINYKWVISITKKIFSKDLNKRVRISYLLNIILGLCAFLIIFSGLIIQKQYQIFRVVHKASSGYLLILVGIHLGLHWDFIKNMFAKVIKLPNFLKKPIRILAITLTIFVGIYSMFTTNFFQWLSLPFVSTTQSIETNFPAGESFQKNNQVFEDDTEHSEQLSYNDQKNDLNEYSKEGNSNQINKENNINLLKILKVIINFSSIILAIAIFTVFLEKLFRKNNFK